MSAADEGPQRGRPVETQPIRKRAIAALGVDRLLLALLAIEEVFEAHLVNPRDDWKEQDNTRRKIEQFTCLHGLFVLLVLYKERLPAEDLEAVGWKRSFNKDQRSTKAHLTRLLARKQGAIPEGSNLTSDTHRGRVDRVIKPALQLNLVKDFSPSKNKDKTKNKGGQGCEIRATDKLVEIMDEVGATVEALFGDHEDDNPEVGW
jgi:hypothetical protein